MNKTAAARTRGKSMPQGRIKITESLIGLLGEKEFSAITTAEIAKNAGVTEALIYKYFKDKRDLLHQVLSEYMEQFQAEVEHGLRGIKGALNKLRKVIWIHIFVYTTNRVFAKILLLEVRNYPEFFTSHAYELVRKYSDIVLAIIEEGIESGELRSDLPPRTLRQCILGCIEQACLTEIIFDRDISPDDLTEDLCEFIFSGVVIPGKQE
jgi:TetR/AcrR family transcriptional regulator, fatty acid metabolism regulator protein